MKIYIIAFVIATLLMVGNKIVTYLKDKGISMPQIRQIRLPHINKKVILGSIIAVAIIGFIIFAPHNDQIKTHKVKKESTNVDTTESIKKEAKKIWEQTVEALNKAIERQKNPFPAKQKDYSGKKHGKKTKKGDKK